MWYSPAMADDTPALDDDAAADLLHRMIFDLSQVRGETVRGDTALTCSRAALMLYLAALIRASERQRR
jgi:hypothetical protein